MEHIEEKPKKAAPLVVSYPADKIAEHFPGTKRVHWKQKDGFWYHSTTNVAARPNVTIGAGTLLGPYVCFGASKPIVIGKNCVIGQHSTISGGCAIGENTLMGDCCSLEDNVKIGSDVVTGSSIYIYPNVVVGDGAEILGGAQLMSNVSPNTGAGVYKPRTQKAKGIKALKNKGFVTPEYSLTPIEDVTGDKVKSLVGRFVRPCPVTPRHGFVDSRPINSTDDAMKLLEETRKADPKAEILTMPFIKAKYSGIWTTGSLTIGPGNDGATSGHGSVRIPVQGHPQNKRWVMALRDAGITEQPYLEILWEGNDKEGMDRYGRREKQPFKILYVQLRNGPSLPASEDFIPAEIKVKRVIVAAGDLLDWETKVKNLAPGTVVYHPGGSLASHYAVHAVLNKIPVLVSRKPKVGETLQPCSDALEPDLEKIKAGFVLGCRLDISYAAACRIMLAGCHSTSLWIGKFDVLLGMAMGCAYRLTISAGLGEARHNKNGMGKGRSREEIYEASWNRVLHQVYRAKYIKILHIFKHEDWRGGYGGQRWFELCQWAGKMYNSILDGNVKQALENLNGAVHAVHNGGWAFNKFICESELNIAASHPVVPLLDVIPSLYPYIADETTLKSAPKWWKNRTKINVDGESSSEKEEPPVGLHNGTDDCGCSKTECKNCYPDGQGCDCQSHSCSQCYPEGCSCKDKQCHDCKKCNNCGAAAIQASLDAYKQKCAPNPPKLGKTNHSIHLNGKSCFRCNKPAYVKFKFDHWITPSCAACAMDYAARSMVLLSEDPDSDYEIPPPPAPPTAPTAGANPKLGVLYTPYDTSFTNIGEAVTAVVQKPANIAKVQARLLNATQLHIQFKKTGKNHESYNIEIPAGQLEAIKELFNKKAESGGLAKSWASNLVAYQPLENAGDGWWKLANLAVKVPSSETKSIDKDK